MARKRNQGSKWIRPEKRLSIYSRDGFVCAFCGDDHESGAVLTLDHLLACELGGGNDETNLITACLSCNSSKRDLSIRSWYSVLRDRGIDTRAIGARIRRQVLKPLDKAEGKRLLALRNER